MLYNNSLEIVPITSEDVAETQGSSVRKEVMKLVRMSWKVASSMQIVVDGPCSNGLPPFGYSCLCNVFSVSSSF